MLAVPVEWLEVHAQARRSIVLLDDDHTVAPLRWLCHGLNDAHANISIDVCFYLLLPVEGNGAWRGHIARGGVRVQVYLQRRASHDGEYLVRALVEGAGREVAEEPRLHLKDVFFRGAEREEGRGRGRRRTTRAIAWRLARPGGGDAESVGRPVTVSWERVVLV